MQRANGRSRNLVSLGTLAFGFGLTVSCSGDGLDEGSYGRGHVGDSPTGGGWIGGEDGGGGSDGGAGAGGDGTGAVDGGGVNVCGDGVRSALEQCDRLNLAGKNCLLLGYDGGILRCDSTCSFDVSDCEGDEVCDNSQDDDLDGAEDCDDPECSLEPVCTCGDGQKQLAEGCDGADFGTLTCETFGLSFGSLTCDSSCAVDVSGCYGVCGDGFAENEETCDAADLKDEDCVSRGFGSGTLACSSECEFDEGACGWAGTCAEPQPIALGSTTAETDGTAGSLNSSNACSGFGAASHERVFEFEATAAGTLHVAVTSASGHGVYVRSACTEADSEYVCAEWVGGSASLDVGVVSGQEYAIIVDGPEGEFTIVLSMN